MGAQSVVLIHYEPAVEWQAKRVKDFSEGLKALGIEHGVTSSRVRESDVAIIFGTTFWKSIEGDGGQWLLVDRASVGDPDFVQLVWNGHGLRGDHKVPEFRDQHRRIDRPLLAEKPPGDFRVICGQCESFSPRWPNIEDWYRSADGTHFRPHPKADPWLELPLKRDFENATAVILNSSVGIDCVFNGVQVEVHDEGAMCWNLWREYGNDRIAWAEWLAWTQWRWDEIREGFPIRHLFD